MLLLYNTNIYIYRKDIPFRLRLAYCTLRFLNRRFQTSNVILSNKITREKEREMEEKKRLDFSTNSFYTCFCCSLCIVALFVVLGRRGRRRHALQGNIGEVLSGFLFVLQFLLLSRAKQEGKHGATANRTVNARHSIAPG